MHKSGHPQVLSIPNSSGEARGPRRPTLAAATCFALACAGLFSAGSAFAQAADYAKGRLLVMPRAGLSDADIDDVVKVHGGKARRIGKSDLHIVDLPGNASETAVQNLLAHHPNLKFAELDRRVSLSATSNDPYFGSEWHLAKIGATGAWDVSQGANIKIAILDTGVDSSHPDLASRMVPGWNAYDNNADTSDVYGHGTAVAGTAAAAINNGVGVASVAGQSLIMPVRIADATGYAYWSTVATGLTWAADNGAKVANISYGGVTGSAAVQSAAQYMKNKGGLVVVAAGNNGIAETISPSATMITVSATNSSDVRASWSSYGSFITISAPGDGIWTTTRGGGYGSWWGTSFASPVTAGVVALMMAANPSLPAGDVESLLYSTATDLGAVGKDIEYGWGRVNASAAVAAAKTAVSSADTLAPTASIMAPLGSSSVSGMVAVNASASDNKGVTKVELRVNGTTVATDSAAPYAFSWDSSKVANGMASLVVVAYDAAGNSAASAPVSVNVANAADTTPPVVSISGVANGAVVSGNIMVRLTASDNSGSAGITQTLKINGATVATGTGGSLSYNWNTRKAAAGSYTLSATARDAAGNTSSTSLQVSR